MKITINAKSVLTAIILVIIIATVLAQYTTIPNPGHGGDVVLVNINGQEKTLQEAIDDGDIGRIAFNATEVITSVSFSSDRDSKPVSNGAEAGQPYNVYCEEGQGVVGVLFDREGSDYHIENMYCAQLITSQTAGEVQGQVLVDYSNCESLGATDGPNLDNQVPAGTEAWRTQCTSGKVMVSLYDNNDEFEDIDGIKCCALKVT